MNGGGKPGDVANPPSAVVIPVHNRRETTVRCLECLDRDGVMKWAQVIVADDGSSDGTGDAVKSRWPDVKIVRGDGSLWWAGAMQLGIDAVGAGTQVVFWLNDDCRPRPGVMGLLARHAHANQEIAVGQAITPRGFVYGGKRKAPVGRRLVIAGPGETAAVDMFGGNCVAFPMEVIRATGRLDTAAMRHFYADADYGLRAGRAGFTARVIGDAWCDNDHNETAPFERWTESHLSFSEIRSTMETPKSWLYWPARKAFYTRHWGSIRGRMLASEPYVRFYAMWAVDLLFGRKVLSGMRAFAHRLMGSFGGADPDVSGGLKPDQPDARRQ